MSVALFLIILIALIVVHELGHFLAARFFGIKVEEFGIGYPPRALRMGKIGDTVFTLNWLPFGGFVKIFGEGLGEEISDAYKKIALVTQSWWKQSIVFVAGVVFNWIFAFVLFVVTFLLGTPMVIEEGDMGSDFDISNVYLVVSDVLPGTPAHIAGIKPGDKIVSLVAGDVFLDNPLPSQVADFLSYNAGNAVNVFYKRNIAGRETPMNVELVPSHGVLASDQNRPAIGIEMVLITEGKLGILDAVKKGAEKTYIATIAIAKGSWEFIKSALVGKADWQNVAGPVGIAGMVGDAASVSLTHLLTFTAMISINLAIINLLPIPALDGGRLLFVLIEGATGRKINYRIAGWINAIGFVALIVLMLFVTWNDILKLIS